MMRMFSVFSRGTLQTCAPTSLLSNISKPPSPNILRSRGQRYLSQRRPKPSTFKNKSSKGVAIDPILEDDSQNLTKLSFDAPAKLRRQALEMYAQCKLSERDPTTRFAIVRQMRNLDLPPHQELWQGINATDELALYRWVDEAFGQLIYQKGLWRPSKDWGPEDDEAEAIQRVENLSLLRTAYEEQILNPLKERFGTSEVTIALSELRDDQKLYKEPAIIWQSVNRKTNEISLEWMSEYTADVVWPGLVSCQPSYQVARRYWEAEARLFSNLIGGVARGMGENGEMLPFDSRDNDDLGQTDSSLDENIHEFQSSILSSAQANKQAAEAVLIKKFLEERNMSSKTTVKR
ncbi:hypothetical protein PGT21_029175 [Puccinia graminis f. sp. tritici]|uniref:Uncharacterized protein n=1 Tax=Puccinia graminis f. sp. tritici TaxID=56615 RepID=A0A5B0NDG0_PUCGR|nr:hypothetical protein PGT21_029175 [Puccinia graminis f. sp. tritici]